MTTITGVLDAYFETGTEGVIWSVYEDGKTGYDGLNCLHTGDHLTIYDKKDRNNTYGTVILTSNTTVIKSHTHSTRNVVNKQ